MATAIAIIVKSSYCMGETGDVAVTRVVNVTATVVGFRYRMCSLERCS